jgi:hypothetical protein
MFSVVMQFIGRRHSLFLFWVNPCLINTIPMFSVVMQFIGRRHSLFLFWVNPFVYFNSIRYFCG